MLRRKSAQNSPTTSCYNNKQHIPAPPPQPVCIFPFLSDESLMSKIPFENLPTVETPKSLDPDQRSLYAESFTKKLYRSKSMRSLKSLKSRSSSTKDKRSLNPAPAVTLQDYSHQEMPSLIAGPLPSLAPTGPSLLSFAFEDDRDEAKNRNKQSFSSSRAPVQYSTYTRPQWTTPAMYSKSDSEMERQPTPTSISQTASLPRVRKMQKAAPSFNIMTVGARSTGKTSFIKTFLSNIELSKGPAEVELRQKIKEFGVVPMSKYNAQGGGNKHDFEHSTLKTIHTQSISAEVFSIDGRVNLTMIDTPGLDIVPSCEATSSSNPDSQLDSILEIIKGRFMTSLSLEKQVVRTTQRPQDSYIHLVLYFIHPETVNRRSAWSSSKVSGGEDLDMLLCDVDHRCIRRLADVANVLPVIARSDELTVSRLSSVKAAVTHTLQRSGLSYGVFNPSSSHGDPDEVDETLHTFRFSHRTPLREVIRNTLPGRRNHSSTLPSFSKTQAVQLPGENDTTMMIPSARESAVEPFEEGDESDTSIKVIRLRPASKARNSAVPRGLKSKLGRATAGAATSLLPGGGEQDTSRWTSESECSRLLPFALVSPEFGNGDKFVREFKHGTLEVLKPEHSDFTPLKGALLGKFMDLLKENTNLEKYEPFRTQQLLASREKESNLPRSSHHKTDV